MDALLEIWSEGGPAIETRDQASVALVREEVRARGEAVGLPLEAREALATAASELGHNQLRHARRGVISVRELDRDGVPGLEVVAADEGPGIADLRAAMRGEGHAGEQASAGGGLGVGLGAVRRLCDELDVESHAGAGTCVRARKLAGPASRRREVAILSRPAAGEQVSGDVGLFARTERGLVLVVADGLGHGPPAREAAMAAARLVTTGPAPGDRLQEIDRALVKTRGAAVAVATIDEATQHLSWATIGNVGGRCHRPHRSHPLILGHGYAGSGRPVRILREEVLLTPLEVVLLFSDGLASSTTLEAEPELLHAHPALAAHHLLERFGRDHDDALIMVAR